MLPSLENNLVNERKFSGNSDARERVIAIVGAYCLPDDKYKEGIVNSIYFDTVSFSSYFEKANGDNIKRKIRLRWYGSDEELSSIVPAFLEVKGRQGSARNKIRLDINVPRELLLTAFDNFDITDFVSAFGAKLGYPITREWNPVCRISYHRQRYFDVPSSSRISVDWDIHSHAFNRRLFPWACPISLEKMVCEFKNKGGTPPPWSEKMVQCGLSFGSFSKYGECMARLIHGVI